MAKWPPGGGPWRLAQPSAGAFVQLGGDHGLCKAEWALFGLKGAASSAFLKQDPRYGASPAHSVWGSGACGQTGASWGSEPPHVSVPPGAQRLSKLKLPARLVP